MRKKVSSLKSLFQEKQKTHLKEFFNSQASTWDNKNRWNAYYKLKLANFCRTLIPAKSNILEIGSATGELLAKFQTDHGTGIDFSPEMVDVSKKKYPNYVFLEDDIEDLKTDKKFQVIVMSDLVDSLIDIWQAFRQLKKICLPETRIILTYHNHLWSPLVRVAKWLGMKTPTPIQNWIAPSELAEVLGINGFEVVREGACILLPLKIPFISDFINKYVAPLPFIQPFCFSRFLIARPQFFHKETQAPTVSIVVPCLNESENISPLLERLPQMGAPMEVIFIDGGSTDGTIEKIQEEMKKSTDLRKIVFLKQGPVKGKGTAVREGFSKATGDILMILDADISVAPEDLPKFYLALVEGKGELINGSRLIYSMEEKAMRFINFLGNQFFRLVFGWLQGQPVRDTLCGTKALYRRDYDRIVEGRSYFGDFDPFGDFDLLFGAARLNLKIVNMAVRYEARRYGTTKIHRWSHGWLLLKMCWYGARKLKFI